MDWSNLSHRIVLHCAIAILAVLAVMGQLIADPLAGLVVAAIGWLAFCNAGYLILCHAERTFGGRRRQESS